MYRYKYNTSYHQKSRKAHRVGVMAFIVSSVVVVIIAIIAVDLVRQVFSKQAPTSQATYSSVQGDSVNLFRSPYFQFQVNDSWKEANTESHDGHYVYRSYKNGLVERDLTIDINNTKPETLALVRTTHVLPVSIDVSGRLIPQGDSGEHCSTLMPKNAPALPTQVTQHQVRFVCTPDAVLYQVVVGVVGGGTNMTLPRPNGSKAVYTITYRDLTVRPTDAQLRSIVQSFQPR